MDIEKEKNLFTSLKTNKIYFNRAAIGPLSTPVVEKIKKHLKERSYTKLNNFDSLLENSKSAKKKLAQMFIDNFKQFESGTDSLIINAGPK